MGDIRKAIYEDEKDYADKERSPRTKMTHPMDDWLEELAKREDEVRTLEPFSQDIVVFDNTTLSDGWHGWSKDGLAVSWKYGAQLYKKFGRYSTIIEAHSWMDALTKILAAANTRPIRQIQFWGHGAPGSAWIGSDALNYWDLRRPLAGKARPERELLDRLSTVLWRGQSEIPALWFRTCSTFCGHKGQEFAMKMAEILNARIAGHTHIIHLYQGGLHTIGPNEEPYWTSWEGVKKGSPWNIYKTKVTVPFVTPQTIPCIQSHVPENW